MTFIRDILISLFFSFGGLVSLYLVLTKYTEEAHQREIMKNKWMKSDDYNYENPIFFRLMSSSYIIAKIALIICATVLSLFGFFLLWLKLKEVVQ